MKVQTEKQISDDSVFLFSERRQKMTLPDGSVRFLVKAGMDDGYLKRLEALQSEFGREEDMIRILRKFRFELLDKIHEKQQCLDSLDYLIYKLREGEK